MGARQHARRHLHPGDFTIGTNSGTDTFVELDTHVVLLAEGLPAESYLDTGNRSAFATRSPASLTRAPSPHTMGA